MKHKKIMSKNNAYKRKVSTHLAFIVMLGLSFLVAWLSIYTGEIIIRNAQQSPTFNFQKRIQQETTQENRQKKENKTEDNLINE